MFGCLGLFFWAILSASIIGALGANEAIGSYLAHHLDEPRPSPIELRAFAYWFVLWASGIVVWLLDTRIWRSIRS